MKRKTEKRELKNLKICNLEYKIDTVNKSKEFTLEIQTTECVVNTFLSMVFLAYVLQNNFAWKTLKSNTTTKDLENIGMTFC